MGEALKNAKKAKVPKKTHLLVQVKRGERTVRNCASRSGQVRWGPAVGIEVPYPVAGVDTQERLFAADRRGARLLLRPGMTGMIHAGSSKLSLEDLHAWGLTRGSAKNRYLPLTTEMYGWLDYRGLRVQFVFGPPPPKPPKVKKVRAKVPLAMRRPLVQRDDWPFTLLSLAMYTLLFFICLGLTTMEVSREISRDDVDARFRKLIYEAPQAKTRIKKEIEEKRKKEEEAAKPAEEAQPEEELVEEETPKEEEPPPEEKVQPEPETAQEEAPPQQSAEERREAIRKEVSKKGLLGVLGGRGGASTSRSSGSILTGSGRAADLDKVLENVEGLRGPAWSGDDWSGREIDDASSGVSAGAAAAAAAGKRTVSLEQRATEEVESVDVAEFDELSMKEATAVIHRTVESYLGWIKYRYNRELRKNPDLEGKIAIAITINPDGSVAKASVVETTMDAPELTKAILARVKSWTFPPVAPRQITVTYPFVFFPSM